MSDGNGVAHVKTATEEKEEQVRAIKAELEAELAGQPKFQDCETNVYVHRGNYIICRTLTPDEFQAFKKGSITDKDRAQSGFSGVEKAFHTALLWPKGEERTALLKRKPGIPATIGQKVLEDTGLVDADEVKKL